MSIITTYTVVTTDRSADSRAAADAINRSLAATGESLDRRAVERELAAYTRFAGSLAIEPSEVEVWEAWLDGQQGRSRVSSACWRHI